MNILVTSAHYHLSDKYGSEANWGVEIINHYAKAKHTVYAIAGAAELLKPLANNVTLYKLSDTRSPNPLVEVAKKAFYPIYSYYMSRKIYKNLNGKVDIVHHIAPTGPVSYDLFFIFRPRNTKANFLLGPAMPPGENDGYKSIARILGTTNYLSVFLIYPLIKLSFIPLIQLAKLTFAKADVVIAVTTEAKKIYKKFSQPRDIQVIPVGINPKKFKSVSKKNKSVQILSIAYLTKRKGIDVLIEAAAILKYKKKINNFNITIVGTGEEEKNLKKQAKQLKISDKINFVGFVENTKISKYYEQADIYCSPTRYEPYGIALVEAMASGLPTIASNVNSIKEIIGEGGKVFKKNDGMELANYLTDFINNPKERSKIGMLAKKRALQTFSWQIIIKSYLGFVNKTKR